MMMGSKPKEEPKPKPVVAAGPKKGIMDDLDDLDFWDLSCYYSIMFF